ncbi:hypothetical protein B7708_05030 [Streptococcus oralis subsp. dentisani]|uniref:Uncharacterized protein n=1 Tax=Streptococcus oralis subsp. dentisani TaxID=1458253 RepID=A0A1X1IZD6_STROR|nr:hypothetical protein B7708_05030 [Streptococcus oralis subsp. dentisani]
MNSHKFSFFDSLFLVVSVAKNDFYIGFYHSFQLSIISDFGEFFNCPSDEKGKLEHRFHLISLFPPFFEQDIKEKQS